MLSFLPITLCYKGWDKRWENFGYIFIYISNVIPFPGPCLLESRHYMTSLLASVRGFPHSHIYLPLNSPTLRCRVVTDPRASPPIDARQGHPLLHIWLKPWPCMCTPWLVVYSLGDLWGLVGWYCYSSYGVENPFSSFSPFSDSYIGETFLSLMVCCKHLLLYLSGSGTASQETAISDSLLSACTFWHPQ